VLSEAEPLPFPVEGSAEVSEDIRLKYRYLDIRRDDTARACGSGRGPPTCSPT
jgi:Aspartyl-tRNA synthetase